MKPFNTTTKQTVERKNEVILLISSLNQNYEVALNAKIQINQIYLFTSFDQKIITLELEDILDLLTQLSVLNIADNSAIQEPHLSLLTPQQLLILNKIKFNDYIIWAIDRLLAKIKQNYIDALFFDNGPGAFTNLRLIASVVQGFCLAKPRKIYPFSSLDLLGFIGCGTGLSTTETTHNIARTNLNYISLIDAKMGQAYLGIKLGDKQQIVTSLVDFDKIKSTVETDLINAVDNSKDIIENLYLITDNEKTLSALQNSIPNQASDHIIINNHKILTVTLVYLSNPEITNMIKQFIITNIDNLSSVNLTQRPENIDKLINLNYLRDKVTY